MTDIPTIALAAIALAATAMGALVWIVKFLLKEFMGSLDKNTASNYKVAEMSNETLTFMRNLNGRLAKITAAKIKENE